MNGDCGEDVFREVHEDRNDGSRDPEPDPDEEGGIDIAFDVKEDPEGID